ncbi:hypothetical protein BKA61DRAFT_666528 [Leptodontidium sp. MPI-SDFR-AT-0119]|nr:hypothetical protein BKA61DRAFT_666528 [Leptodontidium sp. MPI-SDFR-AT-0119]
MSEIVSVEIHMNNFSMKDPKSHDQGDAHEEHLHLQCAAQEGIDRTKRYKQPKDGDQAIRDKNLGGQSDPHIITRDPLTETREEFDPRYNVHKSWKIKLGRVFKVLWPEPMSSGNDPIDTGVQKVHQTIYSKVRRFVIVLNVKEHCICLPINTYTRQGIAKNGVHLDGHALIYHSTPPSHLRENIKHNNMSKHGFDNYSDLLNADQSNKREQHHNLHTVKHNVKVKVVGDVKVHDHSVNQVTAISEQNADTDPDIETKGKSQYSRGKVCKECNGFLHTNEDDSYLRRPHKLNWSPKTHGIANMGCALGMGGTYLWLNKTMGLNPPTEGMKWVLDKTNNLIPSILQGLPNPPDWAIFILFAACTVTFTGTTFLWGSNRVQKPIAKEIACMIAMIGIVACVLAGFGAEEIVLVGMPFSFSLGILASCAVRYRTGEQKEWKEEKRGLVLEV